MVDEFRFSIVEGARLPELVLELRDENGALLDISDFASATFTLFDDSDPEVKVIIDQTATLNTADSTVTYAWQAADASLPVGVYRGRFELTHSDGRKLFIPLEKAGVRVFIVAE